MIDAVISFLKNNDNIKSLFIYVVVGYVVLEILSPIFRTKINPAVFKYAGNVLKALLIVIIICNAYLTNDYDRLWLLIVFLVLSELQRQVPKLVKWYDKKVDELV